MDWNFSIGGHHRAAKIRQPLVVNDTDAFLACGLEGVGVIRSELHGVASSRDGGTDKPAR
jgi:hypothetical protein